MEKTLQLINKKIAEHRFAIEQAGDFRTKLSEKMAQGKDELKQKNPNIGKSLQEVLLIGQEISRHEICIKSLEDLKRDIINENK